MLRFVFSFVLLALLSNVSNGQSADGKLEGSAKLKLVVKTSAIWTKILLADEVLGGLDDPQQHAQWRKYLIAARRQVSEVVLGLDGPGFEPEEGLAKIEQLEREFVGWNCAADVLRRKSIEMEILQKLGGRKLKAESNSPRAQEPRSGFQIDVEQVKRWVRTNAKGVAIRKRAEDAINSFTRDERENFTFKGLKDAILRSGGPAADMGLDLATDELAEVEVLILRAISEMKRFNLP